MSKKDAHQYSEACKVVEDIYEDQGDQLMTLVKSKIRGIGQGNKRYQRTMPIGCKDQALFGLSTVKPDDTYLVITEGEYDAMAVHQQTKLPCVSLPQGASHLPKQLMEFFDRF